MKRILLVIFIVMFSSGFTLQSVPNNKVEGYCPYLNQIHKQIDVGSSDCPYLDGKISEKNSEKPEKMVCPYLKNQSQGNESKSECPYLQGKQGKINNIQPAVHFKLKSS